MAISGHGLEESQKDTFIYDLKTDDWTPSHQLNIGRYFHACGILKDGNDYIIVVAGGAGETTYLSSVELYNLRSGTSWYAGPDMANHM